MEKPDLSILLTLPAWEAASSAHITQPTADLFPAHADPALCLRPGPGPLRCWKIILIFLLLSPAAEVLIDPRLLSTDLPPSLPIGLLNEQELIQAEINSY